MTLANGRVAVAVALVTLFTAGCFDYDALSRDAGAPADLVHADAHPDAAPSADLLGSCALVSAALCEDFEAGSASLKNWQVYQSTGSLTVDSAAAHGGKLGGDVAVPAFDGSANNVGSELGEFSTLAATPSAFYLRLWVQAPQRPATHGDLLRIRQSFAPYSYLGIGIDEQGWIRFVDTLPTGAAQSSQSVRLPAGRWSCLEVRFADSSSGPPPVGSTNGSVAIWLDGMAVDDLALTQVATASYDEVSFGWFEYAPPAFPAFNLNIDDIAAGANRIGCSP